MHISRGCRQESRRRERGIDRPRQRRPGRRRERTKGHRQEAPLLTDLGEVVEGAAGGGAEGGLHVEGDEAHGAVLLHHLRERAFLQTGLWEGITRGNSYRNKGSSLGNWIVNYKEVFIIFSLFFCCVCSMYWMAGQMDKWVNGWIEGWRNEWMHRRMYECMHG